MTIVALFQLFAIYLTSFCHFSPVTRQKSLIEFWQQSLTNTFYFFFLFSGQINKNIEEDGLKLK